MIKVKINNFINNNMNKIKDLGSKLIIVAIIIFIATIILSSNTNNIDSENKAEIKEQPVYKPTETVIKGSNISEEQYETDLNTVEKFLEYCNNKNAEEAYKLISNDCKANLYPTLEDFKKNYLEDIFKEKREYSMQAWITTGIYTIYKIRYTTDMLSTGIYEEDNIYQDYITLIKKSDEEEISIGSFITSQIIDKETETEEINAKVLKKDIYLEYEEYELEITNNTESTIMLDNLKDNRGIKLLGISGGAYTAYINKLFTTDLIIYPETPVKIKIRFNKSLSVDESSKYIRFSKIIKNYETYVEDEQNYNNTFSVKVEV